MCLAGGHLGEAGSEARSLWLATYIHMIHICLYIMYYICLYAFVYFYQFHVAAEKMGSGGDSPIG